MQNEFDYDKTLASKLTIILPLKGRALLTMRYFLCMEEVKCPFKILVADGSLDEENRKVIEENKHRWPHVNFEYYRFPPDNTMLDFYKKMVKILSMVKTPYAMWNSNDDFYVIDTMLKCIEFLESDIKQEYVACGGKFLRTFLIKNRIYRLSNSVSFSKLFYEAESCLERVKYLKAFFFYSVLRTEVFKKVYILLIKLKLTDIVVGEFFIMFYLLIEGKVKIVNKLLYLWVCDDNANSVKIKVSKDTMDQEKIAIDYLKTCLFQKGFSKGSINVPRCFTNYCTLLVVIKRKLEFLFLSTVPLRFLRSIIKYKYGNPDVMSLQATIDSVAKVLEK